ncbi:hypothetical protein DNJ72_05825 [Prochlorococcus marinus XMU1403]|uniref:hypothetical protein n=1 Tax=Prochlorococcus marinus TaxID=1219 RepID=UPI000D8E6D6E|nr:hypothetical protein [Prochlorococcus marinus]PYE01484.1 hypothetical protein DNJ72_05825 [Prochlorococcus marinus XMU1403]
MTNAINISVTLLKTRGLVESDQPEMWKSNLINADRNYFFENLISRRQLFPREAKNKFTRFSPLAYNNTSPCPESTLKEIGIKNRPKGLMTKVLLIGFVITRRIATVYQAGLETFYFSRVLH